MHSGASGRRSACSVCAPAVSRDACSHDRVALAGGWRRAAHIRLSRHSARPADKSERVKYVSLESGSKTGTRAPRRLEWKANSREQDGTARRASRHPASATGLSLSCSLCTATAAPRHMTPRTGSGTPARASGSAPAAPAGVHPHRMYAVQPCSLFRVLPGRPPHTVRGAPRGLHPWLHRAPRTGAVMKLFIFLTRNRNTARISP